MMDFRKKVVVVIGSLLVLLLLVVSTQAAKMIVTDETQREADRSLNVPAMGATTQIGVTGSTQTPDGVTHHASIVIPWEHKIIGPADWSKSWFGTGATAYSDIIDLHHIEHIGIEYQCYGATIDPDMLIEAVQSNEIDDAVADYVECEDGSCQDVITNLTDECKHIESLHLTPAQYLRIKVTANEWTGSSAYCDINVFAD